MASDHVVSALLASGAAVPFAAKLEAARSALDNKELYLPDRERFVFEWLGTTLTRAANLDGELLVEYWKLMDTMLKTYKAKLTTQPIKAPLLTAMAGVLGGAAAPSDELLATFTAVLGSLTTAYEMVFRPPYETLLPSAVSVLAFATATGRAVPLAQLLMEYVLTLQRQQAAPRKVFATICSRLLEPIVNALLVFPPISLSHTLVLILQEGLFHSDLLNDFTQVIKTATTEKGKQQQSASFLVQLMGELKKLVKSVPEAVLHSLPTLLKIFIKANENRRKQLVDLARNTGQKTPRSAIENTHAHAMFDFFRELYLLSTIVPVSPSRLSTLHRLVETLVASETYRHANDPAAVEKYAFLRQIVEVDVLACLDQGDLVGLALGSFDALVRLDHHLVDEHLAATWTAIIVQLQASPSLSESCDVLGAGLLDLYSRLRQTDVCLDALLSSTKQHLTTSLHWPTRIAAGFRAAAANAPSGQVLQLVKRLTQYLFETINPVAATAAVPADTPRKKRKTQAPEEQHMAIPAPFAATLAIFHAVLDNVMLPDNFQKALSDHLRQVYLEQIRPRLEQPAALAVHLMLAKFSLAYAQEHLLTAELVQVHDPEVAEALLYRLRFLTSSPDDRSEARQLLTRCYELVKPSSLKGFKLLLDNIGAIERFGTAEQARSLATVMIQSLVAADEHQEIALETSRLLRTAATFYEMLKMREGILHALDAQLSQMTTTTAKKPKNELHLRRLIAVIAYLPTSYIGTPHLRSFVAKLAALDVTADAPTRSFLWQAITGILLNSDDSQLVTSLALLRWDAPVVASVDQLAGRLIYLLLEASTDPTPLLTNLIARADVHASAALTSHLTAGLSEMHSQLKKLVKFGQAATSELAELNGRIAALQPSMQAQLVSLLARWRAADATTSAAEWTLILTVSGSLLQFFSIAAPGTAVTAELHKNVLSLIEKDSSIQQNIVQSPAVLALCHVLVMTKIAVPKTLSLLMSLLPTPDHSSAAVGMLKAFVSSSSREQYLQIFKLLLGEHWTHDALCQTLFITLESSRPAQLQAISKQIPAVLSRLVLVFQSSPRSVATARFVLDFLGQLASERALDLAPSTLALVFNVLSALQSSPIEQPLFTPSAADIFELHQAIYRVLSGLLRHRIDALEHMLPLVANAVSGLLYCHAFTKAQARSIAFWRGWHRLSVYSLIAQYSDKLPKLAAENTARLLSLLATNKRIFNRHAVFVAADVVSMLQSTPPASSAARSALLVGLFALFDILREEDNQHLIMSLDASGKALLKELHAEYSEHYKYRGKL